MRFEADFGGKRETPVKNDVESPSGVKPPSRAARQLALAYHIERLVDDGAIKDYAEAARMLGVTRARMSQVMNLLVLSPEFQERILHGDGQATERRLRVITKTTLWLDQNPPGLRISRSSS